MKIEDIQIGDTVVYIPLYLLKGPKSEMVKYKNLGVVTSKNDTYVFVCYNGCTGSQATKPEEIYTLRNRPDLEAKITPTNQA